jgi:hypothetical protein
VCSPERRFEMFKSGSTRLSDKFFLWKDLVEVYFEGGFYFRLDKNTPECGNCF